MNEHERLPESIRHAADRVRTATRSLIAAAQEGEAERIDRAIAERGEAVERLRAAFESCSVSPDAEARRALVESLALQAHDAEAELTGLQSRVREGLLAVIDGGKAVRGYATPRDGSSALDRSG